MCVNIRPAACVYDTHIGVMYIHIQRGFDVARSIVPGNAKASICGASDKQVPLFLCPKMSIHYINQLILTL